MIGLGDFSKPVALKVLNPDVASVDEYAERLRDEARVLGLLRHRAIVHVDDLIRLHGTWAVVMEMVEGANLTDVYRVERLPIGPALDIIRELASALDVAHNALAPNGEPLHLLHRDVKPSNIRITPVGEVKLLDFGIARAEFDGREALTRSLAWGSPEYLSPERHDFLDTAQGDVYGLGAVLFEALMGERLGRTSANADRHAETMESRLPLLRQVLGDLNEPVTQFVASMLSFDPNDRPTARQVERQAATLRRDHPEPLLRDWAERVVPIAVAAHEELAVDEFASSLLERASNDGEIILTVATSTSSRLPKSTPPASIPVPVIETIARDRSPAGRELLGKLVGVLVVGLGALWWWQGQMAPIPADSSEVTAPTTTTVEPSNPTTAPLVIEQVAETVPASTESSELAPDPVAPGSIEPAVTQEIARESPPTATARAPVETLPIPSAAPTTGTVRVTGTAHAVRLVSGESSFSAGPIPVGKYAIQAQFAEGGDWISAGTLQIVADAEHTLDCLATFQRCKSK
jgi:serine/threonine-protein kinase